MLKSPRGKESDEFAGEEDDFGAGPGRSNEEVEAREGGFDLRGLIFGRGQLDGLELRFETKNQVTRQG